MTSTTYQTVLHAIIAILKMEQNHEGTSSAITPTELLDKIAALSADLPDIVEMIHGGAK